MLDRLIGIVLRIDKTYEEYGVGQEVGVIGRRRAVCNLSVEDAERAVMHTIHNAKQPIASFVMSTMVLLKANLKGCVSLHANLKGNISQEPLGHFLTTN